MAVPWEVEPKFKPGRDKPINVSKISETLSK